MAMIRIRRLLFIYGGPAGDGGRRRRLAGRRAIGRPLMKPAAEKLAVELQKIPLYAPTIQWVNNASTWKCNFRAGRHSTLVCQLYSPVQWTKPLSTAPSKRAYQYELARVSPPA